MVTQATHGVVEEGHGAGNQELMRRHAMRDDVLTPFDESPGTRFMYRPGVILVDCADAEFVRSQLEHYDATMDIEDTALGLQKWSVPGGPDVVRELVAKCRSLSETRLPAVSANVVFGLGNHMWWGCASAPVPAEPLDTPAADLAGRGPGAGIRVGLIDTGVNDQHPWVRDRSEVRGGLDAEVASVSGLLEEGAGHGTFAAGLILLRAPGATLVVRRNVTDGGLIDDWALAHALLELGSLQRDQKVDLIHMSLSATTDGNTEPPATARALQILAQDNPDLVAVASAGNDGVDRVNYPAAFTGVVSVGALDGENKPAPFTNFGQWVDACANGVNVVSSFFAGNLISSMAATQDADYFAGWAAWSGSSHAAAQVTGAIAARMSPDDGTDPISARQAVFDLVTSADPALRVPTLGTRIE